MAWKIELDHPGARYLGKLERQVTRRILAIRHGRVAELDYPRSIGEALKGSRLGDFWKYRVIVHLENRVLVVFVVRISNRCDVSVTPALERGDRSFPPSRIRAEQFS